MDERYLLSEEDRENAAKLCVDAAKRLLPDGYTIVPTIPTEEMLVAGTNGIYPLNPETRQVKDVYAAMIAAAT